MGQDLKHLHYFFPYAQYWNHDGHPHTGISFPQHGAWFGWARQRDSQAAHLSPRTFRWCNGTLSEAVVPSFGSQGKQNALSLAVGVRLIQEKNGAKCVISLSNLSRRHHRRIALSYA